MINSLLEKKLATVATIKSVTEQEEVNEVQSFHDQYRRGMGPKKVSTKEYKYKVTHSHPDNKDEKVTKVYTMKSVGTGISHSWNETGKQLVRHLRSKGHVVHSVTTADEVKESIDESVSKAAIRSLHAKNKQDAVAMKNHLGKNLHRGDTEAEDGGHLTTGDVKKHLQHIGAHLGNDPQHSEHLTNARYALNQSFKKDHEHLGEKHAKMVGAALLGKAKPDDNGMIRHIKEDQDPCWKDYKMVGMKDKNGKQVPNCVPESQTIDELSNDKLAAYKKAAGADASAANAAGNYKRADKRFSGIVKATNKQFDNDMKKRGLKTESDDLPKHRVGVTISDPNHPMASVRKEKSLQFIRVKAADKEEAIKKGKAFYKNQGLKVHDAYHHSIMTEEQLDEAAPKSKTKFREFKKMKREEKLVDTGKTVVKVNPEI